MGELVAPTWERMVDGNIICESWVCLGACEHPIAECGCGFWIIVCRTCLEGPLTGAEEMRGQCVECAWHQPASSFGAPW